MLEHVVKREREREREMSKTRSGVSTTKKSHSLIVVLTLAMTYGTCHKDINKKYPVDGDIAQTNPSRP